MKDNEQIGFFYELWDRLISPWKFLYSLYFGGIVFLIGGMGIWNSMYQRDPINDIITNLSTYFIAIFSTSVVAIVNSRTIKNQKTFNVFSVIFLFIEFILFIISNDNQNLVFAIIGFILSLTFWIISTSDDPSFKENNIKAAIDKGQKQHGKNW